MDPFSSHSKPKISWKVCASTFYPHFVLRIVVQTFFPTPTLSTISIILQNASIRRLNPDSAMKPIRSILNSGVREITIKIAVFVSVNWRLLGTSCFSSSSPLVCSTDICALFLRTDVAKFFQPSIDCVVDAIMDQKKSSKKDLSVRLVFAFITRPIIHDSRGSISFSLEALQPVIGSLKESRQFWHVKASSSYVPRTMCKSSVVVITLWTKSDMLPVLATKLCLTVLFRSTLTITFEVV